MESFYWIKHWEHLSPNKKIRYDWAPVEDHVTHSAECTFSLDGPQYTTNFVDCKLLKGDVMPGIFTTHNQRPFQTIDNRINVCPTYYSSTPWWYVHCWSGNINGGGENFGHGHYNGAFWLGARQSWASIGSHQGAGNGWIYVQ